MNFEEQHIRFGLGLTHDKRPLDECVLDYVSRLEAFHQRERTHYKLINEQLKKKLDIAEKAHFDAIYNNEEIEKSWGMLGNWNRPHLELHEAIREKIRELSPEIK